MSPPLLPPTAATAALFQLFVTFFLLKLKRVMRLEVAEVRAHVHARPRELSGSPNNPSAVRAWVRARADSPLVRLLLSMYIAQQSTNPVIKEDVGWGESGSPGPRRAEESGSHALTHDAHTRQGGPEPSRSVGSLADHTEGPARLPDRCAPGGRLDPLGLAQRGCPVCARRAVAGRSEGERERGGEREGGREVSFP